MKPARKKCRCFCCTTYSFCAIFYAGSRKSVYRPSYILNIMRVAKVLSDDHPSRPVKADNFDNTTHGQEGSGIQMYGLMGMYEHPVPGEGSVLTTSPVSNILPTMSLVGDDHPYTKLSMRKHM